MCFFRKNVSLKHGSHIPLKFYFLLVLFFICSFVGPFYSSLLIPFVICSEEHNRTEKNTVGKKKG